jgi:anti-anti-sigma factor
MHHAELSAEDPFTISIEPDRDTVAVAPVGELDLASVGKVEREVRALRGAGCRHVVVDLRRTVFLDSTGLRLLMQLRNDAARDGHELTLVPGRPEVARIFELTGTRGLFRWRAA